MQVDFMGSIHGIRSFEGLRARATVVDVSGAAVRVASLDDVIRSKRAAARPRDLAVLALLEKAREAKKR
jgi:predicted nucleotidyltransferase